MKTEVLMERELFDGIVKQKSKTQFFSASDLARVGNRWRILNKLPPFDMNGWLKTKGTREFIGELKRKYGKVVVRGKGRGAQTWVHPLLFIDMALAISPKLKIEVYEWLFDHLTEFRNVSGDSYKLMCGALYVRHRNKRTFDEYIKNVARSVRKTCGVKDWQKASEKQLKARDKLHENIAMFADMMNDNDRAVGLALRNTRLDM